MELKRPEFSPGMAIGIHTHWLPPEWEELMAKEGGAHGAKIGKNDRGQITNSTRCWPMPAELFRRLSGASTMAVRCGPRPNT